MDKDHIVVRKSFDYGVYELDIYFASINGTITIQLHEADLIQLLDAGAKIINQFSDKIKINLPDHWPVVTNTEELHRVTTKLRLEQYLTTKPEAEVAIYIPDEVVGLPVAESITNAAGELMEAMGFEMETEDNPVFGSFFRRLRFLFTKTIANEDLDQLYSKAKKALELKHVDLPTAEQTEKLAGAAEKLVRSLDGVKEGVIRCGALIVLKKEVRGETQLLVHQLSAELIVILDRHPNLITSHQTVYELLTGDVRGLNQAGVNVV